jgi:hypothetical protein
MCSGSLSISWILPDEMTVEVSEVRRWQESITTPEITPPGVPLQAVDAAYVRDFASYDGVLLQLHYGEREPVSQGPPMICKACGHRWGSLVPPARYLTNAERPDRPAKVVRGHGVLRAAHHAQFHTPHASLVPGRMHGRIA